LSRWERSEPEKGSVGAASVPAGPSTPRNASTTAPAPPSTHPMRLIALWTSTVSPAARPRARRSTAISSAVIAAVSPRSPLPPPPAGRSLPGAPLPPAANGVRPRGSGVGTRPDGAQLVAGKVLLVLDEPPAADDGRLRPGPARHTHLPGPQRRVLRWI